MDEKLEKLIGIIENEKPQTDFHMRVLVMEFNIVNNTHFSSDTVYNYYGNKRNKEQP